MHEIGIAQRVLRIVEARACEHGEGQVRSLRLRIGELSAVEPQSLRFALEVCSKGTRAEGMTVEIEYVPARLQCRECSSEREFVRGESRCSSCGSENVQLVGVGDLYVESFVMD